jgi:ferredoxin-NADP reductase/Na+-translocating ferredoxin:NAD+ oxidoreductase RnfD subunit
MYCMSNAIDALLNRITMYRLVLYYLIVLLVVGLVYSFQGGLAYDPFGLLLSISFLLTVCAVTNWAFGRTFGVPTNAESTTITALILALIITPLQGYNDLWFLLWAAVLSMASKYILAIKGKHLFNPAALAVALTYFTINQSASWWVADARMLPFVLVGGLLIVRKIRRFDLVLSFLASALATILLASLINGSNLFASIQRVVLYSPLLFFAFVLLTEPLTTPPTRKLRIIYGALTGFLFTPFIHIGSFFTTPELALVIGNVFSYLASPKVKLVLTLKDKARIAPDTYEFVFTPSQKFAFAPGQYMEWTLGHEDPDSRGNRRYFTLASAPTERELRLGVKFYPKSSSFKKALAGMGGGHEIVASQLAGEFVLPQNPYQKCVFIAGGIGITPFRSMIKYLLDTHQRRSIILFYANKSVEEIVYKDVFDRAERELGIKTIYTVTDPKNIPPGWTGLVGRITPEWITKYAPRYRSYVYYISGPTGMVNSFKTTLHQMGVDDAQIKVDYFAGLT